MLDIANVGSSRLLPVPSKLVEPLAYANDVYLQRNCLTFLHTCIGVS